MHSGKRNASRSTHSANPNASRFRLGKQLYVSACIARVLYVSACITAPARKASACELEYVRRVGLSQVVLEAEPMACVVHDKYTDEVSNEAATLARRHSHTQQSRSHTHAHTP
jgi:hypothetical protein